MPYHDSSLKIIEIPDDRGTINTTWGVALGDTSLSYYCGYCNVIWKANFPRQHMIRVAENADGSPCPGCVQKTLSRIESQ